MSRAILAKLIPQLHKMRWPQTPALTELGRKTYDAGLDKVDMYSDDPKVLAEALRILQTGDSMPYAYAGVAYTLLAASRDNDGSYNEEGLEAAMEWLEKAQESAPDEVDINMIEALVYIHNGRLDDARLVLNYLHDRDPNDYYVHVAEIIFWQVQDDVEQATHWYEKASLSAKEVPQRLRLLTRMGDFYVKEKNYNKALQMYKEALHFNKENPELWHSVSVIHWQTEDFDEAARANKQSLRFGDLPAAQRMAEALKQKQGGSGILSRFRRG
jgi:tetratricopeptide (TPR) repeat protein